MGSDHAGPVEAFRRAAGRHPHGHGRHDAHRRPAGRRQADRSRAHRHVRRRRQLRRDRHVRHVRGARRPVDHPGRRHHRRPRHARRPADLGGRRRHHGQAGQQLGDQPEAHAPRVRAGPGSAATRSCTSPSAAAPASPTASGSEGFAKVGGAPPTLGMRRRRIPYVTAVLGDSFGGSTITALEQRPDDPAGRDVHGDDVAARDLRGHRRAGRAGGARWQRRARSPDRHDRPGRRRRVRGDVRWPPSSSTSCRRTPGRPRRSGSSTSRPSTIPASPRWCRRRAGGPTTCGLVLRAADRRRHRASSCGPASGAA